MWPCRSERRISSLPDVYKRQAFVRADLEARGLLGSTDQMTDSPDAGSYTDAAGTETTDDGSAASGLPVQSAQDVPATAAGEPVPAPEDEARKEGDAA